MTSEVAVMNRLGVALASDSAASVRVRSHTKLYHADKLFMLSKCHPVGVMVNNSPSLVGVPWESILKAFRNYLDTKSFDRLEGYAQALIEFLNNSIEMFPQGTQDEVYLDVLGAYFQELRDEILRLAFERAMRFGASKSLLTDVTNEVLQEAVRKWQESPDHEAGDFPNSAGDTMVGRLSGQVYELVQDFPALTGTQQTALFNIAKLIVGKQKAIADTTSGLVIAGFGNKDHFPVLQELTVFGVFNGRLKCREEQPVRVSHSEPAQIRAFAESEVVDSFLYGSSPALYGWIAEQVSTAFVGQAEVIVDGFPHTKKARKEAYKEQVRNAVKDFAVEFFRGMTKRREELYYEPIVGSIAHLPKSELAHVASTLVSLSSFQKRVSLSEDETVGGPVDVAVITKGDGFVWVDRKHYFKAELNPHFFNNRFTRAAEKPGGATPQSAASDLGTSEPSVTPPHTGESA